MGLGVGGKASLSKDLKELRECATQTSRRGVPQAEREARVQALGQKHAWLV